METNQNFIMWKIDSKKAKAKRSATFVSLIDIGAFLSEGSIAYILIAKRSISCIDKEKLTKL